VGAGSAGSTLAYRLSEIPEATVVLMLSGIGRPEHLQRFDIPVLVDLPGVGEAAWLS
jgi:choline dehydrogenase-like flavoprotein